MTAIRRGATFSLLAVGLVAAIVFGLMPQDSVEADDVTIAAAGEPIAFVLEATSTTEARAGSTTSTVPVSLTTTSTTSTTTTSTTEVPEPSNDDEPDGSSETIPPRAPEPAPASPTTAPAPPTTEAPTEPSASSTEDPETVIRDVFGAHGDDAVTIARCESGLNPRAHNPAGYHGLFQIGDGHAAAFESVTGTDWETGRYQSRPNTVYAKHLFDQSGWNSWGCRHQL